MVRVCRRFEAWASIDSTAVSDLTDFLVGSANRLSVCANEMEQTIEYQDRFTIGPLRLLAIGTWKFCVPN